MAQPIAISEKGFIPIAGIDEWVTIKGLDINKPAILLLHGGPGSVMSPYETVTKEWEKDFIIVNWDQRGAGRTYGRNTPAETVQEYWRENPLTIQKMITDGIAVTNYLLKHLNKQKIIIIGTSWGSVLGVKMALQRPDLYQAYIGHSQVVNASKGFIDAFHHVQRRAKKKNDQPSIDVLESIGAPPYDDAKRAGQLLRVIKKHERENTIPAPQSWWIASSEYSSAKDDQDRNDGDDYSFIHYVGHKKMGIKGMMHEIDFMKEDLNFKVPVYLVQGVNDILTNKEATQQFFNKLSAPKKKYFLVQNAAHGYNEAILDTQYKILREYIIVGK